LQFLYLDLAKPDFFRIAGKKLPGLFLIVAAAAQFLSAKIMMPQTKKQKKAAKKTEDKSDDFAAAMQTQSLYIFPLMTLLIGLSFPSGLILYWLVFSLFNLVQQLIIKRNQASG
jgi:YidC/Oxa1 family membrane protein insertase